MTATGGRRAGAPGVAFREYQRGDGDPLRELWRSSGFRLLGDDDAGLAVYVARNPGLFLVAVDRSASGERIVASAMGAWDGRRGWIYHVATAASHRRTGIAAALVSRVEQRLAEVGAKRVNVLVRDESDGGRRFWTAVGYEHAASSQFAKNLPE